MNAIELAPVLRRLENNFSEHLKGKRYNKIKSLIGEMAKKYYLDFNSFNQNISYNLQKLQENPGVYGEQAQDNLIAFLFLQNAKRFSKFDFASKGEITLDRRDERQIQAVIGLLEGKHLHMGTGEGKSSVIFPITALVKALTSGSQSVVLSTPDEVNLADLKKYTESFISEIKRSGVILPEISFIQQEEHGEEKAIIELKKRMNVEAIIYGKYSPETEKEIKKIYWQKKLNLVKNTEEEDIITKLKKTKGPKIVLATDRDLVFSYSANPNEFLHHINDIYMDEADIPYNRKSPYAVSQESYLTLPENIEESLNTWVVNYLIYHFLDKKKDFVKEKGSYSLTEKAMEKLDSLKFNQIFDAYQQGIKLNSDQKKIIHNFENALRFILKDSSISAKQSKILKQKLINNLKDPSWQTNQEEMGYFRRIGVKISKLINRKNIDYLLDNSQEIAIRDSYTDQILESHEYSPEEKIAVSAIEGKFKLVSLYKESSTNLRFESFVKSIGSRLHCASGTLKYPDPETKKIENSRFASFLKEYTGNDILTIIPPEIKNLPDPELYSTDEETVNKLVEKTEGKKPTLIVSNNITDSLNIYNQLQQKFGKDQVVYIESKPSSSKKIIEYNNRVKQAYTDLADGRIKIIVSSGAAGFAVNILKSDQAPPENLHITIHNLPSNRAQIMQILGRRRSAGDDFSWYVSEDYIEREFFSYFEEKESQFAIFYKKKLDLQAIREQLIEAKTNPKAAKKIILELMRKKEGFEAIEDEYVISFDKMVGILNANIKGYYAKLILQDPQFKVSRLDIDFDYDKIQSAIKTSKNADDLTKVEEEMIKQINNWLTLIGQPDFYFDIFEKIPLITTSMGAPGSNSIESLFNKLTNLLIEDLNMTRDHSFFKSEIVDTWFKQKKDSLMEFKRYVDTEVEPISHLLLTTATVFRSLDIMDKDTKNEWGTILGDTLAYKDVEGHIYILTFVSSGLPINYRTAKIKGFFDNNSLTSFPNRQSVMLSRIRGR